MGTASGSTESGTTASGATAQPPPGSPYVPPELVLPPDGPYGPDPHGRKGPQPPQGSRTRKVAGIVAICALVAAALGQAALIVFNDDGTAVNAYGPPRTVTLPRSLDGGKLTLARDFSDEPGLALRSESHETVARELDPVAGRYESPAKGGSARDDRLIVRGYNGGTLRPESTVHDLLSTLEGDEASGGERVQIKPPGSEVRFICEVMLKDTRRAGQAGVAEVPVCAWADNGSVGAVLDRGPSLDGTYDSDLDAFAERVSSLRSEVSVTGTEPGS